MSGHEWLCGKYDDTDVVVLGLGIHCGASVGEGRGGGGALC